jgi:uncharacterized membrane protein YidH (DUF202 family)
VTDALRPDVVDDEDLPGLAGERTDLAWSRSGLAVVTCAGAILKRILTSFESSTARVVVFGLLVSGGAAWMAAMGHARTVARTTIEGRAVANPRILRTTAYGTSALAGAALVLSW